MWWFKEQSLRGTAIEALEQIDERHYEWPFSMDERKIVKIGVSFSHKSRNIDQWLVETD